MFMIVGTDCGVFFLDESQHARTPQNSTIVTRTLKKKSLEDKEKQFIKNLKRPRGEEVVVSSVFDSKYLCKIGRMQSIQQKYGVSIC